MIIYKVMVRNKYSDREYCDSYWLSEENANNAKEILDNDKEEWYIWVDSVETSD